MPDLVDKQGKSLCWKDCETIRNAFERYNIVDTGPPDEKDLYVFNDNATSAKITKVISNIKRRLLENPDKNFLIFLILAGHGMI